MAENKRYYWIKLKTNFFSLDEMDFLLSQKNGCEYIILYQMLCLNTANNNGEMSSKAGEMIIPYDVDKIVRDTKYFDFDTVTIALGLFKKLGLIYEEEDKILKITNFSEMVGSESAWAEKKRIYREKQKALGQQEDIVRQEIEYRDKSIEIDKDIEKDKKKRERKTSYGEFQNVKLTSKEYESLISDYGSSTEEIIKYLDEYMEMKGTKYKSCYMAIKKWVADAVKEKKQKGNRLSTRKEIVPDWMDKDIKTNEPTEEEKKAFEELDGVLADRVEKLKERLGTK